MLSWWDIKPALDDDPQLTARPTGMRTASRVVVASKPALSLESNLVTTAHNIPVIVTAGPNADSSHIERLRDHGVDVWESGYRRVHSARTTKIS